MKKEVVTQSHSFSCVLYTCGYARVNGLLKTTHIQIVKSAHVSSAWSVGWGVVCGVWCVVRGVWCVVCGMWWVVCGVWDVGCGVGMWGVGCRLSGVGSMVWG